MKTGRCGRVPAEPMIQRRLSESALTASVTLVATTARRLGSCCRPARSVYAISARSPAWSGTAALRWPASADTDVASAESVLALTWINSVHRGDRGREAREGACSMIKCALVPPMPKELTAARRGVSPAHTSGEVLTKNGFLPKSISGFGTS